MIANNALPLTTHTPQHRTKANIHAAAAAQSLITAFQKIDAAETITHDHLLAIDKRFAYDCIGGGAAGVYHFNIPNIHGAVVLGINFIDDKSLISKDLLTSDELNKNQFLRQIADAYATTIKAFFK